MGCETNTQQDLHTSLWRLQQDVCLHQRQKLEQAREYYNKELRQGISTVPIDSPVYEYLSLMQRQFHNYLEVVDEGMKAPGTTKYHANNSRNPLL